MVYSYSALAKHKSEIDNKILECISVLEEYITPEIRVMKPPISGVEKPKDFVIHLKFVSPSCFFNIVKSDIEYLVETNPCSEGLHISVSFDYELIQASTILI